MSIKTSNVFNYAAVDRSKTVGAAANHLPTSINTQAFMYNNNHSIDNAAGSLYVNAAIQLPQQHYLDAPLSAFPVDENVLFSTTVPVPRDSPISQSLAAEMYPGTASLSVEVDNGASMEAGSKLSGHSYDDIPLLHPPPTTSLPPPPPPTAAPSLSSSHHPTDNTLIIPSPVSMEVGLGGNNTVSANSSSAAATTTTSSLGESLHHTATVTTSGGCDSVDDSRDLRRQASESIIVVDSQEAHEYVIVRPKSIQSSCGDIVTPTTASLSTSAGREAGLLTRAISEQMSTSAGYIANSASRRKGGISHHKRSVTAASGLSVPVPDGDHFPIIKSGVVASTSYPPPTAHNRHSRKLSGQSSNSSSSSSISSSYNNNDRFPAGLATSGLNLNLVDAKPLDPVPEVEDNSFLEPLSIHGPEDCSSSTQLLQLQQQNHQEEAVPQPQDCDTRFLTMTSTTSKSSGQYDLAFNNQVEMDQILLCELQRAKTVKSVKSASKIHMTTNLPDLTVQIVDDHIATTSSTSRKMESSIVGGVSTTLDRCSTPTTTLKIPDPFANIVIPPRSHSRDLSGCCGDGDAAPIVPTSLEYEDMVQKNEEVVCTEVSIPVRSKSLVIDDGGGVVFMQHPTPPSTPKHRQSISSTASTETASSRSIRPSSSCSNVIIFDDRQPIASNLIEFCPPPPSFKDSPTLLARAVDGSLNVDDDEKEHDDGRGQMDTVLEMQFHEQQHPPPAPASEVTIQMTSKTAKRFSLFEKM